MNTEEWMSSFIGRRFKSQEWIRIRGTALIYNPRRNILCLPRSVPMPKIEPVRSLWG